MKNVGRLSEPVKILRTVDVDGGVFEPDLCHMPARAGEDRPGSPVSLQLAQFPEIAPGKNDWRTSGSGEGSRRDGFGGHTPGRDQPLEVPGADERLVGEQEQHGSGSVHDGTDSAGN